MATKEEMQAFVTRAADAFAEAEEKGAQYMRALAALPPLMREGRELGMAGYLQSSQMKFDLHSAHGVAASSLSTVFSVHRQGTDIAVALGIDLPQPFDGGGGR